MDYTVHQSQRVRHDRAFFSFTDTFSGKGRWSPWETESSGILVRAPQRNRINFYIYFYFYFYISIDQ